MKLKEIFDVCYARYRGCKALLGGHVSAVDLESPSEEYRWRPDRTRAEEYVADFERVAARALSRPGWEGRYKLFRVYFLRRAEYRRAVSLVGVSADMFDYWFREVKKTCGRAFSRAGLFPPSRYFRSREKAPAEAADAPARRRHSSAAERNMRREGPSSGAACPGQKKCIHP